MSITDGALVAAAQMADRYISDRFLPDKAIDLIDEAGARMRIRRMSEKILFGELRAGQIVTVDVEGTGPEAQLTFEGVAKPEAVPDAPPAVI